MLFDTKLENLKFDHYFKRSDWKARFWHSFFNSVKQTATYWAMLQLSFDCCTPVQLKCFIFPFTVSNFWKIDPFALSTFFLIQRLNSQITLFSWLATFEFKSIKLQLTFDNGLSGFPEFKLMRLFSLKRCKGFPLNSRYPLGYFFEIAASFSIFFSCNF